MNKIIIPSIFVATILVAGMFALMPVQKASTVHTTILAGQRALSTVTDIILVSPQSLVLVDNAGIGGTSDVEIAWRFSDADCAVQGMAGSATTVSTLTNDNALDTPSADTSLAHADLASAQLVILKATTATCTLANGSGDFVTVSTVKGG